MTDGMRCVHGVYTKNECYECTKFEEDILKLHHEIQKRDEIIEILKDRIFELEYDLDECQGCSGVCGGSCE